MFRVVDIGKNCDLIALLIYKIVTILCFLSNACCLIMSLAKHSISFARSSLSISKDGTIKAINHILDAIVNVAENLCLTIVLVKHAVVLALDMVLHVQEAEAVLALRFDNCLFPIVVIQYFANSNSYF